MIHVRTLTGLGDAFAARPTIAALARLNSCVIVETPWPETFSDISNLVFKRPESKIPVRCAERNARESRAYESHTMREGVMIDGMKGRDLEIQLSYSLAPGCEPIPVQIAKSAGIKTEDDPKAGYDEVIRWDDFFFGERERSPLGAFRIPTIRTEYRNAARNPAPGLVAAAVDEIGGDWIEVNDHEHDECGSRGYAERHEVVDHSEEHPQLAFADAGHAELSIPTCLDLVSRARCIVTPCSWMLWAAAAYGTPCLALFGGYAPARTILGPILDLCDNLTVLEPEPFCACFKPDHACEKSIPIERVKEAARWMR